jgi:hypothetical protein
MRIVSREEAKAIIGVMHPMMNPRPLHLDIYRHIISGVPFISILGATQIQKSLWSGLAVLYLVAIHNRQVIIASASQKYAMYPMNYAIQHIDDNPVYRRKFFGQAKNKAEKLKRQESRVSLRSADGGSLKVVTLNEGDSEESRKAALGAGAQTVLFEEASLSSNTTDSMVFRMIAGWKDEGQIIKLGNAMSREAYCDHYYKATQGDEGYVSLVFDWKEAVKQGLYTEKFVEIAKGKPNFDQLYACKFPDPSGLVEGGYRRMYPDELLRLAMSRAERSQQRWEEGPVVGIDVGEGKPDGTRIVARWPKLAKLVFKTETPDTMAQIGEYLPLLEELKPSVIYVDAGGMGSPVASRLRELGFHVVSVYAGGKSPEPGYRDMKAFSYWQGMIWLRDLEGAIDGEGIGSEFLELFEVVYKNQSDKNIFIESKEELRERGFPSYNTAEAFMLTFTVEEDDGEPYYGLPLIAGLPNN